MVDITSFKRDAKAMRQGEWVAPLPEFPTLRIRTRALGYSFTDSAAAKVKRMARKFGGEDRIPTEERARINTEALIETCLLDVEGLTNGGKVVGFAEFCEMLKDDGFGELGNAAFAAATMVGRERTSDIEEASGNSVPVSVQA